MIGMFETEALPIPMVGLCIKRHNDYPDDYIEPENNPLHLPGEIGRIFGKHVNTEYWTPQHLYELSDETVEPGDYVYHKYAGVLLVDHITEDGFYHIKGASHTAHDKTSKKIIATTDQTLGLPKMRYATIQKFINETKKVCK